MDKTFIKDTASIIMQSMRKGLFTLIDNLGEVNISTFKIVDDNMVECVVTKIENGYVHYADGEICELDILSVNEVYDIIIKL